MGKVVKKLGGAIFGGKKRSAAPAAQPTGPIITPLSANDPALDPRRRNRANATGWPLGGGGAVPTILSNKLGA